ncbi:MAG: hypothetical protein DSZ33_03150 [Gammaproteobacteria bacterium]|nr:MAG: hypothetical protein DSZ33_03150 [Gammaproteobacteria bacterium]
MIANGAERFVSLSDFFIAAECAVFAFLLYSGMARKGLGGWAIAFFASASLSALLGGVTHGFFADESTAAHRALWTATMLAIGLGGLTAYVLSIKLLRLCGSWVWLAVLAWLVYVWDIFFISDDFRAAVAFYLPAVILLAVAFLVRYMRSREGAALLGAAAAMLGLLGAYVQQSGWNLHPLYFNHNTVYHLIQAVSFYGLFVAFRGCLLHRHT